MNTRRINVLLHRAAPPVAALVAMLIATAGSLTATAASAQTVYRCGSAYTQVPCTEGVTVTATTSVGTADRQEAERIVAHERRLAREMEDDRHRREAGKPAQAGRFAAASPARPAASAPHRSTPKKRREGRAGLELASADDLPFTARVPAAVRKR